MTLEMPKSVRQIGDCKGNRKIYIEDYVVSFAKQLAKRSEGKEAAGVLLGTNRSEQGVKYLFVSGMVAIEHFAERSQQQFTHDIWGDIYTDIKENFTGLEILGWYYSKHGMPIACNETVRVIHGKNFSGTDKLLYIYDSAEKEEGFFLSSAGVLQRQSGFYIYYEKNSEMRDYMVSFLNTKTSFERVDDTAIDIRNVLKAKKGLPLDTYLLERPESGRERKREGRSEGRREGRYSVGLGTVVVVFAIFLGIVALQNQNTFQRAQDQISNIQETFQGETIKEPEKTEVERLESNLAATEGAVLAEPTRIPKKPEVQNMEEITTPEPEQTADVEPELTTVQESTPTPKPKRKTKNAPSPAFWNYIVQKGDTLSQIALKYYQTSNYAAEIQKFNGLSNVDQIHEGQKLKMPN
ncbi:MAG: LysM peptidoglycan-binding domain-containing protein [Lachnoclostridium sp.]|jgi:nucleoid-associated protein YgaU|nr:LysM peptidoglycan-binding domain-containing protein [Lachnoclostridium sp.]